MGRRYSEGAYHKASEECYPLWRLLFLVHIQALLGHKEVRSTVVNTHVLNQGPKGIKSPVDEL